MEISRGRIQNKVAISAGPASGKSADNVGRKGGPVTNAAVASKYADADTSDVAMKFAVYALVIRLHATGTSWAADAAADQDLLPVIPVTALDAEPDESSSDADTPEETRRFSGIEEIVVTAQKREQNLQDVPISIQAFTADMLDSKGIDEPKALQQVVPGLQYNMVTGYSLIYLRGVGSDAIIPAADPSVASYVDGVYYAYNQNLMSALGVIKSVEVLKGPQGTLFGRNSTGGAISITTKQPGTEPESSVQATLGSYGKTNVRVYTNIPLGDSLAVSVAGLRYAEDNYYKRVNTSLTEFPEDISRAFSVKLGWNPADWFESVLGYSYTSTQGALSLVLPANDPKPLGVALGVRQEPDYHTSNDAPIYVDATLGTFTGDFKLHLAGFDMRLIAADQKNTSQIRNDPDGSSQPILSGYFPAPDNSSFSGELQFLSNDGSWGSSWLSWVGGLYYIETGNGFDPGQVFVAPGLLSFLANPPADGPLSALRGVTQPLIGLLASIPGVGGLAGLLDSGIAINAYGRLETESAAAFFQGTANLTDWMALTVGGRYQRERRALIESTVKLQPVTTNDELEIPLFDFGEQGTTATSFAPKAVLDFKIGDDQLLYVSYNKAYKSGTYNTTNITERSEYILPEEVNAYEIGLKSTLFDNSLRLNAAAFWNDVTNLQIYTMSLTSGGILRMSNVKGARIRGAEFDALWSPLPSLLPSLMLNLGGCWLDGVYTDYKNGAGYDEVTGLGFGAGGAFPDRDFTGNTTVRTPEFSGNAGIAYSFDVGDGTVDVATDVYYNSGIWYSQQNRSTSWESAYTIINAQVGYHFAPWNLRVTAYGKNIADTAYYYNKYEFDFATLSLLAPPSTYGVSLAWEF